MPIRQSNVFVRAVHHPFDSAKPAPGHRKAIVSSQLCPTRAHRSNITRDQRLRMSSGSSLYWIKTFPRRSQYVFAEHNFAAVRSFRTAFQVLRQGYVSAVDYECRVREATLEDCCKGVLILSSRTTCLITSKYLCMQRILRSGTAALSNPVDPGTPTICLILLEGHHSQVPRGCAAGLEKRLARISEIPSGAQIKTNIRIVTELEGKLRNETTTATTPHHPQHITREGVCRPASAVYVAARS